MQPIPGYGGRLNALEREDGSTCRVPVTQFRFTHGQVKTKFRDGSSIYETLRQLDEGELQPSDLPALDVCEYDGKLWSLSNRRLRVLLMYQAIRRDRLVYATCTLRSLLWKKEKFVHAFDTLNDGLGIDQNPYRIQRMSDSITPQLGGRDEYGTCPECGDNRWRMECEECYGFMVKFHEDRRKRYARYDFPVPMLCVRLPSEALRSRHPHQPGLPRRFVFAVKHVFPW